MSHSAHLLIALDKTASPPTIIGAGIFSCGPGELTVNHRRHCWLEHSSVKANSYQEALDIMARTLHGASFRMTNQWIVDLLEKSGAMPLPPEDDQ